MKLSEHDSGPTRAVLIGMITDKLVLGTVCQRWTEKGLFPSEYANLIGGWCVDYYNRYGKAPRKRIERLFEAWSENAPNNEVRRLAESFLEGLSGEYQAHAEETNSQFVIDLAAKLFDETKLRLTCETVLGHLDAGRIKKAKRSIEEWGEVQLGQAQGIDLLQDEAAIDRAFQASVEPLIILPDAYGEFVGNQFARDRFVSFMAIEKMGKSFFLGHLAWHAMLQKRRVAFFALGDMGENDVIPRFGALARRRPLVPQEYRYPISINRRGNEKPFVKAKPKKSVNPLTNEDAKEAFREISKHKIRDNESYFKLFCRPAGSVNVANIAEELRRLDQTGWTADVIVIDYADIMAPEPNTSHMIKRDQINETWMALRGLATERFGLVLTCTQANLKGFQVETLTREHCSEDKRKFSHVTGMLGINQTREEKQDGIYRLNWLAARSMPYDEFNFCYLAGCLAISHPAVCSCL